jgi:hypothetical protein
MCIIKYSPSHTSTGLLAYSGDVDSVATSRNDFQVFGLRRIKRIEHHTCTCIEENPFFFFFCTHHHLSIHSKQNSKEVSEPLQLSWKTVELHFFFFCQILCKIYGDEISKILTIKKNEIQENETKYHKTIESNTSVSL